jgi:hypothetical protein
MFTVVSGSAGLRSAMAKSPRRAAPEVEAGEILLLKSDVVNGRFGWKADKC